MPDKMSINTEGLISNKEQLCSVWLMTLDPQRQKSLRVDFQNVLQHVLVAGVMCVINGRGVIFFV